jgi:hypothetical protein
MAPPSLRNVALVALAIALFAVCTARADEVGGAEELDLFLEVANEINELKGDFEAYTGYIEITMPSIPSMPSLPSLTLPTRDEEEEKKIEEEESSAQEEVVEVEGNPTSNEDAGDTSEQTLQLVLDSPETEPVSESAGNEEESQDDEDTPAPAAEQSSTSAVQENRKLLLKRQ